MAERRMFSKVIIDTDIFLDMPISARLLYYDLAMRADDDGFVSSPKKIMKIIGATVDDLNVLITRQFVIPFNSGVLVIKHWKIHNYIRKDTYKETPYKEEKSTLCTDENNSYVLKNKYQSTDCQRAVDDSSTQDRLGKDSKGKDSIGYIMSGSADAETEPRAKQSKKFCKPSVEEVHLYCQERNNNVDAQRFIDYYTANGWKVGKNPMKDWKAAVRTWEQRDFTNNQKPAEVQEPEERLGTYY